MNSKERFLSVIRGEPCDKTPVFPLLMAFSARRYGATYGEFASNGSIFAESQIKIYEMFKVDAITSCTDAFRVSAYLGGEMVFPKDEPPHLARPLVTTVNDLIRLKKPDVADPTGRMADRIRGTEQMIKAVGKEYMVLRWVDMPFAEACSLCGVAEFLLMLYDTAGLAHKIKVCLIYSVQDVKSPQK